MSRVVYNSIELPYASITDFRQEAVADEEGHADWYCTKFDITIQCVLNADYLSVLSSVIFASIGGQRAANDAVTIMKALRTTLMKRRRTLSVTFNGVELIPQSQAALPGTVDAQNGPVPQYCNIIQLMNNTFLLSYRITAHYWESNVNVNVAAPLTTVNLRGNDVLYNRWTETHDIDSCNFSKRIRRGAYKIRSDNFSGKGADWFREDMVPLTTPPGWLRESSSYTITPDGLGLKYQVVDKEVYKLPPYPAFEAEGKYTESTPRGGAISYGEVWIRLKGDRTFDARQGVLIETAVSVALSKLAIQNANAIPNNLNGKLFNILEGAKVTVDMYNNVVECLIRAALEVKKTRIQGLGGLHYNMMPFTPGSEPGVSPAYFSRGTLPKLLQAAAYFDPSLATLRLQPDNQLGGAGIALEPGEAGVIKEA